MEIDNAESIKNPHAAIPTYLYLSIMEMYNIIISTKNRRGVALGGGVEMNIIIIMTTIMIMILKI